MTATALLTREMGAAALSTRGNLKSIVVATDASDTALPAFEVARMLHSRTGAEVHVITVVELLPAMLPTVDGMVVTPQLEHAREEVQREGVRSQLKPYDHTGSWSLDVKTGIPADTIASFAREVCADLIVIGANKHGVIGRIFGEETASEIVRLSETPLLVASPQMDRIPRRIVIAMGLEPEGLHDAARSLRPLVELSSISCVHVKPRSEMLGIDWVEYDGEYELAMRERYKQLQATLDAVKLSSDLIVLHGDVAHEIADFAEYSKAELIVVGAKRDPSRPRAIKGKLAARIIRKASCSVLVVPGVSGQ